MRKEPCSCGSGCACGCCEGTEPLTPQTILNRPGLDALAYRIGTHSSFLETMKARLSSAAFPALGGLRTREASDPSIALLDAWAMVADVLTFYQERIAEEGYLRTATERRSVLELAQLVGYSPRPGVAASTYLAYTLDEGPETVIPAGARAQSVPGPGELPQPFETSEDLIARAAWNNFQVRLTRPQRPEILLQAQAWPVALYFQGIATNLKPNDALLIKTDCLPNTLPALYRARIVTPEPALDRTRVDIEGDYIFYGVVAPEPALSAAALQETLERSTDLKALGITRGGTAQRVLARLEPLQAALEAGAEEPVLRAAVEELLPRLREEKNAAVEKNASRLEPWIGGMVAAFEEALAATAPPVPMPAEEIGTVDDVPATTGLADVLTSLARPLTPQPRSSRSLDRDVRTLFGRGSDLSAQLLTVDRRELRDVLYTAWQNVPVAPAPCLDVCALRARASLFGHNAPRKFVRRETGDGVVTKTEEWTFEKEADAEPEPFSIELTFDSGGDCVFVLAMGLVIEIGNQTVEHSEPQLKKGSFVVNFSTGEPVVITVSELLPDHLQMTIDFKDRDYAIDLDARGREQRFEQIEVTSRTPSLDRVSVTKPMFILLSGSITIEGSIPGAASSTFTERPTFVWLDTVYPQILPGSWIVLDRPTPLDSATGPSSSRIVARALTVSTLSRSEYGIAAKATLIELDRDWIHPNVDSFSVIRETAVYAQCENLPLAEEPFDPVLEAVCGNEIELSRLVDGLQPGRLVIVSGVRTDVGQLDAQGKVVVRVPGVPAAELAMLAGVTQGVNERSAGGTTISLPGERTHTTLTLAQPLAYCYKRDTVTIYGNVVRATHGETRSEVMGSGDGAKVLQTFTLKQPPLTYVSAPTPSGIESTLQVRVNDLLWHEAESLAGLGPTDRSYTLRTDDGGQTSVIFGNGVRGARLPTGQENVRALYRSGIGRRGNVKTGQISQLATRPLGVKEVINPLPATGGADRESRDQARRNAPLALMALDRLISVQDYEDFARTFAGVGKASAARLSDGRVQLVHVTIAGEDDIPILPTSSDLFRNLEAALRLFGDPWQPLRLAVRERTFLIVKAEVKVLPDYQWEKVEPKIRAALLDAFGFARRDLGQAALLSEVFRTVQGVRGVDYVDVDVFASRDPEAFEAPLAVADQPPKRLPACLARIEENRIRPAQLLYLTPEVPDTLILKERKS